MMHPLSLTLPLWLLLWSDQALAARRTYNLTLQTGIRAPDGVSREVYLINGQQPGPLIEAEEGDDLEIFVQNRLPVEQTIHWHGLLQHGTPDMDGVPGVSQFPIPPGGNFTYRFSTGSEYGFYWYHSHFRAYYNDAVRGPLLIHPSPQRRRPFESLAQNDMELYAMLRAERNATPLVLSDWYHRTSDVVYNEYFTTGAFPQCVDSLLANGRGRVQCLPASVLEAGPGLGMTSAVANDPHDPIQPTMPPASSTMSSMQMSTTSSSPMSMASSRSSSGSASSMSMNMQMSMRRRSDRSVAAAAARVPRSMDTMSATAASTAPMASMSGIMDVSKLGPKGCSTQMMFKPGFNASSLPPETCNSTMSDLFMFNVDFSLGWAAIHLVNAGAVSRLSVSLDSHSMYVYAADGLYVEPQEVKVLHISIGQRYSVMVRLNQNSADYYLRYASYPYGDMQQVIEGQATMSYQTNSTNMTRMSTVDDVAQTYMLVNGSAKLNAVELDDKRLAPFDKVSPPRGAANVTHLFAINQTGIVNWVVNGREYSESKRPIVYGNESDGWSAATTLHVPGNSTIDILMYVAEDSMDTMGHPMHLHGHKFWLLGSGEGKFPYRTVGDMPSTMLNLQNPPYRDTIDLPASGWAVIRYVTDNPGAWLFHCHVQWHLVSGMAVVLVEDEARLPSIVGSIRNAANSPNTTGAATSPADAVTTPVCSLTIALLAAFMSLLMY